MCEVISRLRSKTGSAGDAHYEQENDEGNTKEDYDSHEGESSDDNPANTACFGVVLSSQEHDPSAHQSEKSQANEQNH